MEPFLATEAALLHKSHFWAITAEITLSQCQRLGLKAVGYCLWWFVMRFAAVAALFLFYVAHPFSNGQTPFPPSPSGGHQGAPVPPLVKPNPGTASPSPEDNHKQLLADVQELITEAQMLQQDLEASPGRTVTAQSFKRSQKLESLSKRIRKTLKAN